MNLSRVTIVLDSRRHPWQPGEVLSGAYEWSVVEGEEVRAVEVSILWRTEGKGDEDFGVHFFDRIASEEGDELSRDGKAQFSAQLPNSPLSYDGAIVKIRWLVRVRVFLKGGKELLGQRDFQLGSAPRMRAVVS